MSLLSIYGTKALLRTCNRSLTGQKGGRDFPADLTVKGGERGKRLDASNVSRTHYPSACPWRVRREVGVCACMVTLTGEKHVCARTDPDWGYSPGASLCSIPGWFCSGSPEPRSGLNLSPKPVPPPAAPPSSPPRSSRPLGKWPRGARVSQPLPSLARLPGPCTLIRPPAPTCLPL